MEKQPTWFDGVRPTIPCESQMVSVDGSSRRVFTGQRHTNSDEFVLSAVRKVEEILLFGSDAAKGELKESLEGDWFGGIVEVLETCINKLTDRQMMKVRENFQK
jgi:hypothetical protein